MTKDRSIRHDPPAGDAPARPVGVVRLGGREWRFTLHFNAWANLAELPAATVPLIFDVLAQRRTDVAADFLATRALLWAALKCEAPDLTAEMVGEWIDDYLREGGEYTSLTKAVMAAWDMPRLNIGDTDPKNAEKAAGQ